jgi:hypothetical protein
LKATAVKPLSPAVPSYLSVKLFALAIIIFLAIFFALWCCGYISLSCCDGSSKANRRRQEPAFDNSRRGSGGGRDTRRLQRKEEEVWNLPILGPRARYHPHAAPRPNAMRNGRSSCSLPPSWRSSRRAMSGWRPALGGVLRARPLKLPMGRRTWGKEPSISAGMLQRNCMLARMRRKSDDRLRRST